LQTITSQITFAGRFAKVNLKAYLFTHTDTHTPHTHADCVALVAKVIVTIHRRIPLNVCVHIHACMHVYASMHPYIPISVDVREPRTKTNVAKFRFKFLYSLRERKFWGGGDRR